MNWKRARIPPMFVIISSASSSPSLPPVAQSIILVHPINESDPGMLGSGLTCCVNSQSHTAVITRCHGYYLQLSSDLTAWPLVGTDGQGMELAEVFDLDNFKAPNHSNSFELTTKNGLTCCNFVQVFVMTDGNEYFTWLEATHVPASLVEILHVSITFPHWSAVLH